MHVLQLHGGFFILEYKMQLMNINTMTMSSREIAELTGKEHSNVLADVRIQFAELYDIEKDDCNFNDKLKQYLSIEFDNRWQELEAKNNKPMSMMEIVAHNANHLLRIEQEQNKINQRILELESKSLATQENYYTMSGYCNLKGLKFDDKELAILSRQATKISKIHGFEVKKFHSAKFGQVNQYHKDVLEQIV